MNKLRIIVNLVYSLLILIQLINGFIIGEMFYSVIISIWIFLVILNFNTAEKWKELYFKTRNLMFQFRGFSDKILEVLMAREEQIIGLLREIEDKKIRTAELLLNLEAQGYLKC